MSIFSNFVSGMNVPMVINGHVFVHLAARHGEWVQPTISSNHVYDQAATAKMEINE